MSLSSENIWRQINWPEIGCDSLPRTFSERTSEDSALFSSSEKSFSLERVTRLFWLPLLCWIFRKPEILVVPFHCECVSKHYTTPALACFLDQ